MRQNKTKTTENNAFQKVTIITVVIVSDNTRQRQKKIYLHAEPFTTGCISLVKKNSSVIIFNSFELRNWAYSTQAYSPGCCSTLRQLPTVDRVRVDQYMSIHRCRNSLGNLPTCSPGYSDIRQLKPSTGNSSSDHRSLNECSTQSNKKSTKCGNQIKK